MLAEDVAKPLLRMTPIHAVEGHDKVLEGEMVSSVKAPLDVIGKRGVGDPLLFLGRRHY